MKKGILVKFLCLSVVLASGVGLFFYLQHIQADKAKDQDKDDQVVKSWSERSNRSASTEPAEAEKKEQPSPKPSPEIAMDKRREAFLERRKQNETMAKAVGERPKPADDAESRARRAEMAKRRAEQIDQSVKDGRIGPLEAEFRKLMMNHGDDPQAHREAMMKWRQENGEALMQERQARSKERAATNGHTSVQAAERRNQMIDRAVSEGRMGPLEAERMKLMQMREGTPEERREMLNEWHKQNGDALKREIESRRSNSSRKPSTGDNT